MARTIGEPNHKVPIDMPASLANRLREHKERTGESMRQVVIKSVTSYLDAYDYDEHTDPEV